MTYYIDIRIIDGKPRKVIIDDTGKVINRNPVKDELKDLEKESYVKNKKLLCTDEELLGCLRQFYEENGRSPTIRDFINNPEYPSSKTYKNHFGSWNSAIKMAGLDTNYGKRGQLYTNRQLLEYLKKFYEDNGRVPFHYDFNNNPKYPSFNTYIDHFGSWNSAIEKVGLQVNRFTNMTDEELLGSLRQFYEENGRVPSHRDFNNNPIYPSFGVFIDRFGSWNNALEITGLQINRFSHTTDEELLEYLKQFYEENGRPPTKRNFNNNPRYPCFTTYIDRFGSWHNSLKLVELDIDTMVRKGIIETSRQKGRFFEIYVLEHFTEDTIDVAGDNCTSPFDGICPKGQIYDAKSSAIVDNLYWYFRLNKGEGIDFYYLGAFDKDFKKLLHVWRIPGDLTESTVLYIGLYSNRRYNLENMKEFEITDKFKDIGI